MIKVEIYVYVMIMNEIYKSNQINSFASKIQKKAPVEFKAFKAPKVKVELMAFKVLQVRNVSH